MPRSTGDETFDAMLDGGVPAGRTVLLRGGPGTGARRLATGFFAAGAGDGRSGDGRSGDGPAGNAGEGAGDAGEGAGGGGLYLTAGSLQESIRSLVEQLAGQPVLAVLEVTPVLHLVDEDQARQLFYWASANVLAMEGLSLVLSVDRAVAGDELAAFFSSTAEQVFRIWQGDEGIQYLSVRKSPDGSPDHSRAVEPLSEAPFVRLR